MGDYTNAPDVHLRIVSLLLHNFWCHIEGTSKHLLQTFLFLEEASKAEICELDIEHSFFTFFRCKQDIFGFDIPMYDILLMHIVEGKKNLFNHICCLTFCQFLGLDDVVVQFATCYQL